MNLKMINDYVLIDLIDNSKISNGGIILTSVEPPCTGKVISVGPGKVLNNGERTKHNISIGDIVIFGKSSLNKPIEEDYHKYYVMTIDEIFGKKND